MKKIIIIGCPGSGKSTFARKLQSITGLPLYYLDMLWHKPDKTTVSVTEFDRKLKELLVREAWIIDGNYIRTLPMRLAECDTVFWLDYPVSVCLGGIEDRFGRPRVDMPWVETQRDEEFMEFVRQFHSVTRPEIKTLLGQYGGKQIIFSTREEADAFIDAYADNV